MVAHRTSPTNIGLYLLATACAQRFGWIGTRRDDRAHRGDARDPGDAAAPSRPLPQLVRHALGRGADAAIRLDRRQRQPLHAPARARAGVPGAQPRAAGDDRAAARARRFGDADRLAARRGQRAARRPKRSPTCSAAPRRSSGSAPTRRASQALLDAAAAELAASAPTSLDESMPTPAHRLAWAVEDHLSTLRSALRDVDERRSATTPSRPGCSASPRPAARSPPSPTSASSSTASGACSTSAFASPSTSSTAASTTCSPRKRARPACGRSPRATFPPPTGSRSAGRSTPSARSPACARGRDRCSST